MHVSLSKLFPFVAKTLPNTWHLLLTLSQGYRLNFILLLSRFLCMLIAATTHCDHCTLLPLNPTHCVLLPVRTETTAHCGYCALLPLLTATTAHCGHCITLIAYCYQRVLPPLRTATTAYCDHCVLRLPLPQYQCVLRLLRTAWTAV